MRSDNMRLNARRASRNIRACTDRPNAQHDTRLLYVSQKRHSLYFSNNCVKNRPISIIFGSKHLEETCHLKLQTCPPHLQIVAALPCEMQKVIFQQDLAEISI